jgi:hypothetical protein
MDAPLTPKIQNKRRSSTDGCSASSGSGGSGGACIPESSDNNNDTFDCQSLQRCLKRVRLTASITPGELRLQRDLRHAVLSRQWLVVQDECEWIIPYQPPPHHLPGSSRRSDTNNNGGYTSREEMLDDCMFQDVSIDDDDDLDECVDTSRVSVRVTRDEQDPMELVLRIEITTYYPVAWSDNACTTTSVASVTLHLQFPRMYPHLPPVVRRIEYHPPPYQQQEEHARILYHSACTTPTPNGRSCNNPDRWTAGNLTNSNWSNSSPVRSPHDYVYDAADSNDGHDHSQHSGDGGVGGGWGLQRIVIAASPDCHAQVHNAANGGDSGTPGTVVLTEWSPVSRLTDICEWLIETVVSWQVMHQTKRRRRQSRSQRSGLETLSTSGLYSTTATQGSHDEESSSPSTPTTCNLSTVALRHRLSGEEKKDSEDGTFWTSDDSSSLQSLAFAPLWSAAATMPAENVAFSGGNMEQSQGVAMSSVSSTSSDFLPDGRFDVGYDRESNLTSNIQYADNGSLLDVMDCQYDV